MSLESKIEALTTAINALNVTLTSQQIQLPLDVPILATTPKEITEDDLKAKCLQIAKTVTDGKSKAKEILKEYDALKVSALTPDQRPLVMVKLEALL